MEIKYYFGFSLLIILIHLIGLNAQADKCSQVLSPKIYSECGVYDSLATSTVCCLIRGVYGGNNGTACIPVDSLFANKSVSLTTNGATGTMVCGANVSSSNRIKSYITRLIICLMFILIFWKISSDSLKIMIDPKNFKETLINSFWKLFIFR